MPPPAPSALPLRVGSSGDYPPFSLRAPGGELTGFDVAVAEAFTRARGRRLELVPFRWPDLSAALARGDFAVAMSGVTIRPERLWQGRFTDAVVRTAAVLLLRRTAPRTPAVAVNRGGHLERVARATLPDVRLVVVDDNRALGMLLRDGRVDGIVTDELEAAALAPELAGVPLEAPRVLARDRKAYWLPPDAAALADELDTWLRAAEQGGTLPALRARFGLPDDAAMPAATAHACDLVGRRMMLMPAIAAAKQAAGRPIVDPAREAVVLARAEQAAVRLGLAPAPYVALTRALVGAAVAAQQAVVVPRGAAATAALPDLETLRLALDRIDAALAPALAEAVPLETTVAVLSGRLVEDAGGTLDASAARALARALRALRRTS
ncbi:MAG: transporter substrate-binding domain-containing protein [bacterium]|nr:transporter substrate-binding domain-containing protein [bacterium]